MHKVEFGDFQTPDTLASEVCSLLRRLELSPKSIVEPTCGQGSFLRASVAAFPTCPLYLGFDVNPNHVQAAGAVQQANVHCEDFFKKDWPELLNGLREPILVIGNPPWVTNSTMGALGGNNLPSKSNSYRFSGLDAITGKSNFDISEWMLLRLLQYLSGKSAVLAMLCKAVVARKVLHHAWSRNLQISMSAVYSINADKHFHVAVDACLLVCKLEPGAVSTECAVYLDIDTPMRESTFALRNGRLVADVDAFATFGRLFGMSPIKWRSGVKHDCSQVMELHCTECGELKNGFGETANIEPTYLYPMLKSSELMRPHSTPSRYMLVTQRSIGEETAPIEHKAPQTWCYLQSHADRLDRRASSIYRNQPRFSVFGTGPYSFAPWKVATSGFYKRLDFRCVGPFQGKPVVLDDTCYFLPCRTEQDAGIIAELLNSKTARNFFRAFIFWDAKRPITAQLLSYLDLGMLAREVGAELPLWSDAGTQQLSLKLD